MNKALRNTARPHLHSPPMTSFSDFLKCCREGIFWAGTTKYSMPGGGQREGCGAPLGAGPGAERLRRGWSGRVCVCACVSRRETAGASTAALPPPAAPPPPATGPCKQRTARDSAGNGAEGGSAGPEGRRGAVGCGRAAPRSAPSVPEPRGAGPRGPVPAPARPLPSRPSLARSAPSSPWPILSRPVPTRSLPARSRLILRCPSPPPYCPRAVPIPTRATPADPAQPIPFHPVPSRPVPLPSHPI